MEEIFKFYLDKFYEQDKTNLVNIFFLNPEKTYIAHIPNEILKLYITNLISIIHNSFIFYSTHKKNFNEIPNVLQIIIDINTLESIFL